MIIICFGTYSILFILHWDLFHSFNISLWTCLTVLTIIYDLLQSWIFLWITCQTSHNSNNFFVRITYHFLNKQMAFHLCGSLHDFFKYPFLEIICPVGIENGFSPVWVLSCFFKLVLCENDMSHLVQANGLSSVWVM